MIDLKISPSDASKSGMAEEPLAVSNATLYSLLQTVYKLLQTVRLNQTQIIIPTLSTEARNSAAFQIDLDLKLAALDAKLNQILVQVTPPETGDTNPATAKIS